MSHLPAGWSAGDWDRFGVILAEATGDSYAVFDCDNTLIHGDIGECVFGIQVAEGLLDLVTLATFPPASGPDGKVIRPVDDPVAYYQIISRLADSVDGERREYASSVWLAQVSAGHTLAEYVDLARRAARGEAGLARFPAPTANSQALEIVALLGGAGVPCHVVSAGTVWGVRTVIAELVNPRLADLAPTGPRIRSEHVHGVGTLVRSTSPERLAGDRQLRREPGYLSHTRAALDRWAITSMVDGPVSWGAGKVATILDIAGGRPPLVAVGDSWGDQAMWHFARHAVRLAADEAPVVLK